MGRQQNTMKILKGRWLKEFPLDYSNQQYQDRAQKNHMQSLETLNGRGGLGSDELICILSDCRYKPVPTAELALMEMIIQQERWNGLSLKPSIEK